MKKFAEIKTDYTDDENITHVDTFRTTDENEVGKVVALICRDSGKVVFTDNDERLNPQVREAIACVLVDMKKNGEVSPSLKHYLKSSLETYCKK